MQLLRRSGTSDIWAMPPGGLPVEARRSLKAPIAFGLAVTLGVGAAVGYSSMRASTAVSADDALAEFQAAQGSSVDDSAAGSGSQGPGAKKNEKRKREGSGRRRSQGGPSERSKPDALVAAAGAPSGSDADADPAASASSAPSSSSDRSASERHAARPQPPREGVYAWQVDGYEQAPGVRRDLPARSHRVINHRGPQSWTEHHIFSEEKEQWMNLSLQSEGVTATSVRNRVVMGPVEEDGTVVYNPPVFVARLPNEVGRTWRGSWEGRTSGTYTGRTFDHTTVTIQGEKIEVWATEVVMTMRGELEGTATTRSWYSPKHSIVVKQYQIVDIESGPGSYRSEWTGQVLSVTPQT